MEVDAASFPHHLLGLLINISEADFVSFDLELSGIPSRLPNKPARGPGRFTLEERYAETKIGADRYQILQVGLTCARFDYIANKYVLRPYNINISPLLDERLDFEREVSFQSGACSFLLSHGFDLGAPFARGVQYLSREEAEKAKQMAWDRIDKKNPIADLHLKDEDVESRDFMRRVREAIKKWKTGTSSCLEVTTHTGLKSQPTVQAITRFEKRLVHQLVRAEFPDLVSMGRADCIRIIYLDVEREADNTRRIKNRVKEQIYRQTGFRWIFEALVKGGNVDRADPLFLPHYASDMTMTADAYDIKGRYDRAMERLKTRQPVLVGHNMFTDIVYLYRTFVGELPATLQGFQRAIHGLFPKIVDTKYMATHAEGDLNASPTLQEIAQGLDKQMLPRIVTHEDHPKYQNTEAFHEAGYDSLLTATVMLRLAAKLGAERNEPVPAPITNGDASKTNGHAKVQTSKPLLVVEPSDTRGPQITNKKSRSRKKGKKSKEATDRRFQTKNIFDTLRELRLDTEADAEPISYEDEEEEPIPTPEYDELTQWDEPQPEAAGSWEDEDFVQDTTGWVPIEQMRRQTMELIPAFESRFWEEFGNTLRVFGTEEAVLRIADWKA